MRVAIPTWDGRVSPVFDVARRLVLLDVESGQEVSRKEESIDKSGPAAKTQRLTSLGVDVLVCGAISGPLAGMLTANGMKVIPWICGDVENVFQAFLRGHLFDPSFLMPGCCGRRRQLRGGHCWGTYHFSKKGAMS